MAPPLGESPAEIVANGLRKRMTREPAVSVRHLVLVGVNFTPRRATGDKNFWAALLPLLAADVDRISIISIREENVREERLRIGGCEVEIRYVPPALQTPSRDRSRSAPLLRGRGGSHPRLLGLLGKQLVTRRVNRQLADLLRGRPASRVHLMDNFGPANHLLARTAHRHGANISVSAIAYERRGRRMYDWFLRLSYRVPGSCVVALSRQFKSRLWDLGVGHDAVTRIPWGVLPPAATAHGARMAARARLGLPPDRPLVLWAGFIQQVREPDFHLAYRLTTRARAAGLDATVLFAFKPETFRPEYASLHTPDDGIHVFPTPVDVFRDVLAAADLLLSPIGDRDCIVAPPLTWIEAMSNGLPILTTDIPGANELIENGKTGFLAGDEEELMTKLFAICGAFDSMREACRAKIAADYNLEAIRHAYITLWFGGAQ